MAYELANHAAEQSEYRTAADFSLVYKLLEQGTRYKIPEFIRDRVIQGAAETLGDPEATYRDKNAAAKVILLADKHNIELVKMALPKRTEHTSIKSLTDEELRGKIDELLKLLPPSLVSEGAK